MQLEKVYSKRVKVQITGLDGNKKTGSCHMLIYEATAEEVEELLKDAVERHSKTDPIISPVPHGKQSV